MLYDLGIDLGTTYTAAAVQRAGEDRPEAVALGTRLLTTPSVVHRAADGAVLVGEAAERRAPAEVGLGGVLLLAEPHAAALAHAHRRDLPAGATVAVYDLGGGTFDAA